MPLFLARISIDPPTSPTPPTSPRPKSPPKLPPLPPNWKEYVDGDGELYWMLIGSSIAHCLRPPATVDAVPNWEEREIEGKLAWVDMEHKLFTKECPYLLQADEPYEAGVDSYMSEAAKKREAEDGEADVNNSSKHKKKKKKKMMTSSLAVATSKLNQENETTTDWSEDILKDSWCFNKPEEIDEPSWVLLAYFHSSTAAWPVAKNRVSLFYRQSAHLYRRSRAVK